MGHALEKAPGKAGMKLGALTGIVVMTSPVIAGIELGAVGTHKDAQKKECNTLNVEVDPSNLTDV